MLPLIKHYYLVLFLNQPNLDIIEFIFFLAHLSKQLCIHLYFSTLLLDELLFKFNTFLFSL